MEFKPIVRETFCLGSWPADQEQGLTLSMCAQAWQWGTPGRAIARCNQDRVTTALVVLLSQEKNLVSSRADIKLIIPAVTADMTAEVTAESLDSSSTLVLWAWDHAGEGLLFVVGDSEGAAGSMLHGLTNMFHACCDKDALPCRVCCK